MCLFRAEQHSVHGHRLGGKFDSRDTSINQRSRYRYRTDARATARSGSGVQAFWLLRALGGEIALQRRDQFNVIDLPNAWKVDLIVRKSREFSELEFARREPIEVGDLKFVIARPEDVLLAKLEWMKITPSDRQLQDAVGILTVQREQLDRSYIEKWVSALGVQEQWRVVRETAG